MEHQNLLASSCSLTSAPPPNLLLMFFFYLNDCGTTVYPDTQARNLEVFLWSPFELLSSLLANVPNSSLAPLWPPLHTAITQTFLTAVALIHSPKSLLSSIALYE